MRNKLYRRMLKKWPTTRISGGLCHTLLDLGLDKTISLWDLKEIVDQRQIDTVYWWEYGDRDIRTQVLQNAIERTNPK